MGAFSLGYQRPYSDIRWVVVCFFFSLGTEFHKGFVVRKEQAESGLMG